jgi:hypothetical protein
MINANFFGRPRLIITTLILVSLVPLLWPAIPPITDLFVHIGRYSVAENLATDPLLQRYYDFNWAVIPNLGVDLLVLPLSPLVGLEPAVKLIVMLIVALTVAAFALLSRQAHNRIAPTALFALPLVYGFSFQFGFVNFCLSMALAFLGFFFWNKLGDEDRLGIRYVLAVPFSIMIWITHAVGWGVLGLFAAAAEIVRLRDSGKTWMQTLIGTGVQCLSLATPMVLMIMSKTAGAAQISDRWFDWVIKFQAIMMALVDRWQGFDLFSIYTLLFIIAAAFILRAVHFDRRLGLAALFLFITYLLMPWELLGSTYADMRLSPFVLAIALLAIDVRPGAAPRLYKYMMIAGLAFFLTRTIATTISFLRYDRQVSAELEALPYIPVGARVVTFITRVCTAEWGLDRLTHLPSIGLARRSLFVNDQFGTAGVQLLSVHYPQAEPFTGDPSQGVAPIGCVRRDWRRLSQAIQLFPRSAFDYVWIIDVQDRTGVDYSGLRRIWHKGDSALYKIEH